MLGFQYFFLILLLTSRVWPNWNFNQHSAVFSKRVVTNHGPQWSTLLTTSNDRITWTIHSQPCYHIVEVTERMHTLRLRSVGVSKARCPPEKNNCKLSDRLSHNVGYGQHSNIVKHINCNCHGRSEPPLPPPPPPNKRKASIHIPLFKVLPMAYSVFSENLCLYTLNTLVPVRMWNFAQTFPLAIFHEIRWQKSCDIIKIAHNFPMDLNRENPTVHLHSFIHRVRQNCQTNHFPFLREGFLVSFFKTFSCQFFQNFEFEKPLIWWCHMTSVN